MLNASGYGNFQIEMLEPPCPNAHGEQYHCGGSLPDIPYTWDNQSVLYTKVNNHINVQKKNTHLWKKCHGNLYWDDKMFTVNATFLLKVQRAQTLQLTPDKTTQTDNVEEHRKKTFFISSFHHWNTFHISILKYLGLKYSPIYNSLVNAMKKHIFRIIHVK